MYHIISQYSKYLHFEVSWERLRFYLLFKTRAKLLTLCLEKVHACPMESDAVCATSFLPLEAHQVSESGIRTPTLSPDPISFPSCCEPPAPIPTKCAQGGHSCLAWCLTQFITWGLRWPPTKAPTQRATPTPSLCPLQIKLQGGTKILSKSPKKTWKFFLFTSFSVLCFPRKISSEARFSEAWKVLQGRWI